MSLLNAAMNGASAAPSGALTPGAYAAGVARQAINDESVALALYLADTRGDLSNFFDVLTRGGVSISSTSVTDLLSNTTDLAAIAASTSALEFVTAGSSEILNAILTDTTAFAALLANQDCRYFMWTNDALITAIAETPSARTQIRAAGTLRSKAEDDQNAVSMETGVTGGNLDPSRKYLLLGVSLDANSGRTITFTSRRVGSSRPDSGTTSSRKSDASVDVFCPLENPFTFSLNANYSGVNDVYWLDLDCTPSA